MMARGKAYAERQKHRPGYQKIRDKNKRVIDEVPIDFPDPATWDTDPYWLEYLATMWIASNSPLPPTIEELQWRNRKIDEEVAGYRMMLEFYAKRDKLPSHLTGGATSLKDHIKAQQGNE